MMAGAFTPVYASFVDAGSVNVTQDKDPGSNDDHDDWTCIGGWWMARRFAGPAAHAFLHS